jgi:hypothetical protein
MLNWGIMTLTNERNLIKDREESIRISNDIGGLTGERKNPSIKKHSVNSFSPKISVNDVKGLAKSNSEKYTNSSMFSGKSLKLTEEIKRIKKLMT